MATDKEARQPPEAVLRRTASGKPYFTPDGKALSKEALAEKAEEQQAAYAESYQRNSEALAKLAETYTVTGVRISDPKDAAYGAVVTFNAEEAQSVMGVIQNILAGRNAA